MTELHSFVFLENSKSNKPIRNGNITTLMSKFWWTWRPWNQAVCHWGKKKWGGGGCPKIPNEKLFHSCPWFHRKNFFMEKSCLSQMAIYIYPTLKYRWKEQYFHIWRCLSIESWGHFWPGGSFTKKFRKGIIMSWPLAQFLSKYKSSSLHLVAT